MTKTIYTFVLTIFISMIILGGCTEKQAVTKPVVAVSILPQQYFAQRIGGEHIEVMVMVGPGQSPHSWDPSPQELASFANASAWILSGTDFEIGLQPKVAAQFSNLMIVDGTDGVAFRLMEEHSHEDEDGDHEVEHADEHKEGEQKAHETEVDEPGSRDKHTWLGKEPARIMAVHIRDTLITIDSANAPDYEANYQSLVSDIDSVFADLKAELAPLAGKTVFVFHPAFGYFLDEFDMIQMAVETGGKEPSAKNLAELINEAREFKPAAIFVQSQFPVTAATTIANDVGAKVVFLDPLAPEWMENIKIIGQSLKEAL